MMVRKTKERQSRVFNFMETAPGLANRKLYANNPDRQKRVSGVTFVYRHFLYCYFRGCCLLAFHLNCKA